MSPVKSAVLAVILVIAVAGDLRARRIPNVLTFPGLALGLLFGLVEAGWSGLWTSLLGAGAGLGLLFLPFSLGGIGAGDVKLLAVVGAFGGPAFVLRAFLAGALAGGAASAFVLWRQGRLWPTLKTALWDCVALVAPVVPFLPLPPAKPQEEARGLPAALPYGLAIAFGAAAAWFWRVR
jgi:prepilin peptidase CpaA